MKTARHALNMCEDCTMKKLSPLFAILLALLMQVRVAYACEMPAFGALHGCEVHGFAADEHPGQPSDRGDRCDAGIDLAVRAGRTCTDLAGAVIDPAHGDLPALPAAPLVLAGLHLEAPAVVPAARVRLAPGPGARLWLETARLRL